MTDALLLQPAHVIAAAVRARRVSAREVTLAAIARINAQNGRLRAFTDMTFARALAEADAVDAAIEEGDEPPLAGVPYAVKNLFDVAGIATRAGSKINRSNPVARDDATLVQKMAARGAVLLGALNMGEYAYDFTGENAHDGNSLNPHDPSRMSGGSSGGSGTAVASGMVAASLGSDTNGSIRVPSSFCGLFGLKPTLGRLSRAGTFPFCAGLDHLGPIARSVTDLALILDGLQGDDENDPAQISRPPISATAEVNKGIAGLRIAVADGYFRKSGMPEAYAAVDHVASALGVTRTVTIPEAARARAAAYIITTAESSTLHLGRLKTRAADFDPDTRDRLLSGAMVPAPWVIQAHRFRSWFRDAVRDVFRDVDVILAPATPFHALPSGTKTVTLDGVTMPARPNIGLVFLGTLAAYAFSRFKVPIADDLLFFILSTRFMPPIAVAIPIYLMYRATGLSDTKIGMIILYTAVNVSLAVWLLKGFIDEIPREYEEAAMIDGYTRLQAFWKVVLPQAATGIAATAIFCLIFAWNEYAFAVLLTSGTAQTMPPFIPFIIGEGGQDWPAVASATTLFLVPILVFTVLLRKHLLRGITFGAVRK